MKCHTWTSIRYFSSSIGEVRDYQWLIYVTKELIVLEIKAASHLKRVLTAEEDQKDVQSQGSIRKFLILTES